MRAKLLGACVALVVVVPVMAGSAGADPTHAKNAAPITLVCDNGQTYNAVTNSGNSNVQTFSPAHDIASTSVLVPTSFGPFSGTITDSSGAVIDQFTDPPATKGNSHGAGSAPINCTFSFSETFTVTETGGDLPPGTYTFTGSGSATGFIPSQK
jgi:hypothetical protein